MEKMIKTLDRFELSSRVFYYPEINAIYKGIEADQEDVKNKLSTYYDTEILKNINYSKVKKLHPNNLYLFTTEACNANCKYCYAYESRASIETPYNIGEKAIDYAINNSLIDNIVSNGNIPSKTYLRFMGGGEPTYAFDKLKHFTMYAKEQAYKKNSSITIGLQTNGYMDECYYSWILENMDEITVSYDGPGDIQIFQRPYIKPSESYSRVKSFMDAVNLYETIRSIEFIIRSTITDYNVFRMREIIDDVLEYKKNLRFLHLEPLRVTFKSKKTGIQPPSEENYINNYFINYNYALRNGLKLYNSADNWTLKRINNFCGGINGKSMFVSPEGYISRCTEVTSKKDEYAKYFICGQIESNGLIKEINYDKTIISNNSINDTNCSKCFCKYLCGGGCPLRKKETGFWNNCYVTKETVKRRILEIAEYVNTSEFSKRYNDIDVMNVRNGIIIKIK